MSAEVEDLDALIIHNLDNLDAAASRLYDVIHQRIGAKINETVAGWANNNKWTGEFDWWKKELWVAPPDWKSKDGWIGKFFLDELKGSPEEKDVFWLTELCKKGKGELGFRFYCQLQDGGLGLKKSDWNKLLREHENVVEAISKTGLVPENSGMFFTQVRADSDLLAEAIKDDSFDTALAPFRSALDRILAAREHFEVLLNAGGQLSRS